MIIRTWHYYFLICFATCRSVRILSSSGKCFNIQHLWIWPQNAFMRFIWFSEYIV